jgi:excisionase family DNA binding protein
MSNTTTACPAPVLITVKETAALLGITSRHFNALRSEGKIGPQCVRLGACIRFRRDEISAWIAAGAPDVQTWKTRREAVNVG